MAFAISLNEVLPRDSMLGFFCIGKMLSRRHLGKSEERSKLLGVYDKVDYLPYELDLCYMAASLEAASLAI